MPTLLRRYVLVLPFGVLISLFATLSHAHPADISHLKVKVEPRRIEFHVTFNLYTLQQFHLLDADRDNRITRKELDAAEAKLRRYITEHVLVTINGEDADLGESKRMDRMWPADSAGADIETADYGQRYVNFAFVKTTESVVDELWIGFNIFEETGELHVVQAIFEQDGKPTEVSFARNEPEYTWATGFPETAAAKVEPTPVVEPPPTPTSRGIHPVSLILGIIAFGGTWLLLRKVNRISQGGFKIGSRE